MGWPRPVRSGIVPLRAPLSGATFPGGVRAELHDLAEVLLHVTEARGYHCRPGWCWGYTYRRIRGGSSWSNHSGGAALDINAPRNPMTDRLVTDMPAWMPAMWTDCGWRWGGDYRGRKDAMHYEHLGGPATLARDLTRARAYHARHIPVPRPPPPPPARTPTDMEDDDMRLIRSTDNGAVWLLWAGHRYRVETRPELDAWAAAGADHVVAAGRVDGHPLPDAAIEQIPWPHPHARPHQPA